MENFSKKKRGRPVEWNWGDPLLKTVKAMYPPGGTRSSKNHIYTTHADILLLDHREELAWLFSGRHDTLLAEIGHMALDCGEAAAIDMARVLCENKPTVKNGIRQVRQMRLEMTGRRAAPPPDPHDLYVVLVAALNDYVQGHPDADQRTVSTALVLLGNTVAEHYKRGD